MSDAARMLESLVDAAQALAQPSEIQERLLPSFVVLTDELAQNFSDAYLLVDQIRDAGLIDATQKEAIDRVEELLKAMSNKQDGSIWSIDGLRNSEDWQRVRLAAKSLLDSMGRELRAPTFPGVSFVRSRKP